MLLSKKLIILGMTLFVTVLLVSCDTQTEATTSLTSTTPASETTTTTPVPLLVTLPSGETEYHIQGTMSPGRVIAFEFEVTQDSILRTDYVAHSFFKKFLIVGKDNDSVFFGQFPNLLGIAIPKGTYLLTFYDNLQEYSFDFDLLLFPMTMEDDLPVPSCLTEQNGEVLSYHYFLPLDYYRDLEFISITLEGPSSITVSINPDVSSYWYSFEGTTPETSVDHDSFSETRPIILNSPGTFLLFFSTDYFGADPDPVAVEVVVTPGGE